MRQSKNASSCISRFSCKRSSVRWGLPKHLYAAESLLASPFLYSSAGKAIFLCTTLFIHNDITLRAVAAQLRRCTEGKEPRAHGTVTGKQLSTMTKCARLPSKPTLAWAFHIAAIMFNAVAVIFIMWGKDKWCWRRLELLGSTSFSVPLGFDLMPFAGPRREGKREELMDFCDISAKLTACSTWYGVGKVI